MLTDSVLPAVAVVSLASRFVRKSTERLCYAERWGEMNGMIEQGRKAKDDNTRKGLRATRTVSPTASC